MYFKGDIIITDPCYIPKKNKEKETPEYYARMPKKEDFFSISSQKPSDYPDGRLMKRHEMSKMYREFYRKYKELSRKIKYLENKTDENSVFLKKWYEFDIQDILDCTDFHVSEICTKEKEAFGKAYEAWSEETRSDWIKCNGDLTKLGLSHFISSSNYYGDWSCATFNVDNDELIGKFCADAGMVGVFLLDEVLAYNPNFDYHLNRPWTTTLIKDFDGNVEFEIVENENDKTLHVVGTGNVNFKTIQIGF